mmetsp:Transcript_5957/g.11250  ORF Transcript_5957/g.11250 Transcript_5957/m.11250 type:complete len:471 (+) Transcript_5957:100-1512(+)|eukprot:CAMPEP_0176488242 /NCGR_PEP_ID=MMETSP0200_2-20121128/6599_1 /TAXON_ID=947934 /ORGANISM="Chaetoceros sp., Strain GSL56" /LENGTH=470 /DNA_ID=CAMNT_0017885201 /DNA_START=87 /DNA_END=1499 /DNA_ORIENTATION=-
MQPSSVKRNDEGRQRILELLKKQRSLSSSPINRHDGTTTLRNASALVDHQQQPQSHYKETNHEDGAQESSTQTLVVESPNAQQRNIKKRKWIQKRARAVREAISPQKKSEKNDPASTGDFEHLKRQSDSSTEPDDSFDNDLDDDSINESLDSTSEQYQNTPPILHCPSLYNKEPFTLQDVKFISYEFDSCSDGLQCQSDDNNLRIEIYPSDEKSARLNMPKDTFDTGSSDSESDHLSSPQPLSKSCEQNQESVDNSDDQIQEGNVSVTVGPAFNDNAADGELSAREWDTSRDIVSTFRETVESPNYIDEGTNLNLSQEFAPRFEKMPSASKDSAMLSVLSSEEANRLNSMLKKVSKHSIDDKPIQSNWWDDESKLASFASPRSIGMMDKAKTKRRDTFDSIVQSLSSFFEDLKLDCSFQLCSDIDDRIGHEIDVNDGLQSVVEDDITFDYNSMLMNSSTTTGKPSKKKTR